MTGRGPSALAFALAHPDRCWGLVLVSTAGGSKNRCLWLPSGEDPRALPLVRRVQAPEGGERSPLRRMPFDLRSRRPGEDLRGPRARDPLAPFARYGKVLADRIPGAELVAVEGGEHVAIFTHRDRVRARVAKFLREHAPS